MGDEAKVEDTMGADLAAAWDASEDERIGDETPPEPTPEITPAEELAAAPKSEEPPAEVKPAPIAGDETPPAEAAKIGEAPEDKAPVGLSPEAREVWKDAPKALREAIVKRETDYATGIQQYAQKAQRAESMDRALQPFQQFFATNGNNPAETISGVLQTASVLQMGSPNQKAQAVAQLIKQFSVDIRSLDSLLVGEAPAEGGNDQMGQMLDQRLGPINQFMQGFQQNQQDQRQQAQNEISTEVDAFSVDPKNEFYNDLKMDMADLMDLAANRGINMSMQDAYDKAVMMHPQISAIVSGRLGQKQVDNKRRAASSISGGPGGPGPVAEVGTTRAALEDAWDNAGRT